MKEYTKCKEIITYFSIDWRKIREFLKIQDLWKKDTWSYHLNKVYLLKFKKYKLLCSTYNGNVYDIDLNELKNYFGIKSKITSIETRYMNSCNAETIVLISKRMVYNC